MPDPPQTAPPSPILAQGDPEGLVPIPPNKPLPSLGFSCLASVARRSPFFSAIFLYAFLVGGIAGVAKWSYNRDARPAYEQIPYNDSGVALIGHSYRLDLTSQMLSVKWEIVGCGAYRLPTYPPVGSVYAATGCDSCNRALDIYINGAPNPAFSYDPTGFPSSQKHGPIYVNVLNVFNVDHSLDFGDPGSVPFDTYSLSALAFVIEKATNKSVPIITFAAGEGPDNFVVSSIRAQTKNNYAYDSGTGPTTVEVGSSMIVMTVKRSQLARAFTVCLLLINTALTIGSAYITLLVVFRRGGMNDTVLLLPVTIVLTVPALRGLYVGSPPFGIYIDTFGFFLQMMTVAPCSMILLYIYALSSPQDRQASHESGKP